MEELFKYVKKIYDYQMQFTFATFQKVNLSFIPIGFCFTVYALILNSLGNVILGTSILFYPFIVIMFIAPILIVVVSISNILLFVAFSPFTLPRDNYILSGILKISERPETFKKSEIDYQLINNYITAIKANEVFRERKFFHNKFNKWMLIFSVLSIFILLIFRLMLYILN